MSRGYYRGNVERQLADALRAAGMATVPTTPPPEEEIPSATVPALPDTLTSWETARSQGFTGDACSNCGSMKMQVAGHCTVCADCGTTTGCS